MFSGYTNPALADYQQVRGGVGLDLLAPPEINLSWMFQRYLLQKAISVFKWTIPETWDKDYFLYSLYCFGRVAVVNTDKFGVIPQACGLMGYNVYYRPTNAIISNALLTGILQPRIDVQCTVLKLQPDYGGIMDLVTLYANLMAQACTAVGVNFANSKLAYAFFAENKALAETFKRFYDAIANGQPAVAVSKDLADDQGRPRWTPFQQDIKNTYIAGELLRDLRTIENRFDNDIGIPNANTEKRERMLVDEVNANNVETYSKCELWLEQLRESCKKANAMFPGLNLSVDWRHAPKMAADTEGGVTDVR